MGTRSITYVYDEDEKLVCMYRQFDGYPSGHGAELGNFLKDIVIVNGLRMSETRSVANRAGCLAAQMIQHFKEGPGGIYLHSVNAEHDYVDYVYGVHVIDHKILVDIDGGDTLEKCTVEEFIKYCSECD
jgi:predicted ThiF/HesA family dinucleotide-utilizing enzyme